MTAPEFDIAHEAFFARYGRENFDVYDGRVLFGTPIADSRW